MKKIIFGKPFRTAYQQRIAPNSYLVRLFRKKLKLFEKNRQSAELYDHPLVGRMQGLRAFHIDYDLVVVYEETPRSIIFVDIGSHRQVYT